MPWALLLPSKNGREKFLRKIVSRVLRQSFMQAPYSKGKIHDAFIWFILSTRDHTRPYNDGPSLVSFFMKPISIDVMQQHREEDEQRELKQKRQSVTSKPEYLLFLKKRKDGLYEAVSGQMDPGLSVRALFELRSLR